jgi:hypothetical protein
MKTQSNVPLQDTIVEPVAALEIPMNPQERSSLTSCHTTAGMTMGPTDQNLWHWTLSSQDTAARLSVAQIAPKLSGTLPLHKQIVRLPETPEKSHNKAVGTAKSTDIPQCRTLSLFFSVGQPKSTWAIPPNLYKTPQHANQSHHVCMHSPMQTVHTGVDNEVLGHPPLWPQTKRSLKICWCCCCMTNCNSTRKSLK